MSNGKWNVEVRRGHHMELGMEKELLKQLEEFASEEQARSWTPPATAAEP